MTAAEPAKATPIELIDEHQKVKANLDAWQKQFDEYVKPAKARMEEIVNALLALLLEQGVNSFATDAGTAYKSTIVTPKVTDKTAFLDFCLEDWDTRGAMVQIGAPQKDALQEYQDANDGRLPPFVETSAYTRVNVRKS